jgi:lipoprotein-releasing system permease protein
MSENQVPAWSAPYRLVVALRLLRVRKINLISILGVTLGVGAIIVVMAVMDGFQLELRTMIRGTLSDLIVEVQPDRADEAMRGAVELVPGVAGAAIQWQTFGAIPARDDKVVDSDGGRQNYLPVRIVGLVPGDEARVSRVLESMRPAPGQPEDPFEVEPGPGEFVPEDLPRVALSEWIARKLGHGFALEVGERVTLITLEAVEGTNGGGPQRYRTNDREAVISRIYKSGNSEFDKLHVYVDMTRTGRTFFSDREGVVAEVRVKLDDYMRAREMRGPVAAAAGRIDPRIARDPDYFVQTWEERQHNLLRAVNNEKFLLAFVLFFIVVVACFTIFATLTMTVVEKTRDIGVLRALGATPGGICSIFMLNGTLVGGLGAGLGYGAGLLVAHNVNGVRAFLLNWFGWDIFPADIYLFDEIPTHIDHAAALWFAVGAAVCAVVFAVVPSVRAARLRPVTALRYE